MSQETLLQKASTYIRNFRLEVQSAIAAFSHALVDKQGRTVIGAADGNVTLLPGAKLLNFPVYLALAIGDETTTLTTNSAAGTFRAPLAFKLTGVRASMNTASSSGAVVVDLKSGGSSLLSTAIHIDQGARTSVGSATPAVISTAAITDDEELVVAITGAGSGAKGLKVTLLGARS